MESPTSWWLLLAAFGAVYVLLVRSIRRARLRLAWSVAGALALGVAGGFCSGALLHSLRFGPPPDMGGVIGGIFYGLVGGAAGALLALVAVIVGWVWFRPRLGVLCAALTILALIPSGFALLR